MVEHKTQIDLTHSNWVKSLSDNMKSSSEASINRADVVRCHCRRCKIIICREDDVGLKPDWKDETRISCNCKWDKLHENHPQRSSLQFFTTKWDARGKETIKNVRQIPAGDVLTCPGKWQARQWHRVHNCQKLKLINLICVCVIVMLECVSYSVALLNSLLGPEPVLCHSNSDLNVYCSNFMKGRINFD